MPGSIQSDRIEGEFGILRGSCGGNFYMSAEQVASVLQLQWLKLFSKLGIQFENTNGNICCNYSLAESEEDLELVENYFEAASSLTVTEKTNLFYISGYVARKEGIPCSIKKP